MTSLSFPNRHTVAHRLIGQILALCGDRADVARQKFATINRAKNSPDYVKSRHPSARLN